MTETFRRRDLHRRLHEVLDHAALLFPVGVPPRTAPGTFERLGCTFPGHVKGLDLSKLTCTKLLCNFPGSRCDLMKVVF